MVAYFHHNSSIDEREYMLVSVLKCNLILENYFCGIYDQSIKLKCKTSFMPVSVTGSLLWKCKEPVMLQ